MRSGTTQLKRFRWYHLYYLLAAFDIATISMSLYLNHTVLDIYAQSVQNNSDWSERLGLYTKFNELAADVNAPGNDAFDSGKIEAERVRLEDFYSRFQQASGFARKNLIATNNASESELFLPLLKKIDNQVALIHAEALKVLLELEQNNSGAAGARMAEMDRCFSRSLTLIGNLCEEVRSLQARRFSAETARAQRLGRFEFAIAGVVGLILIVVTWYGHKLAGHMRQSEEESQTTHLELKQANQKAERLSAFGKILDSSLNEIYIFDSKSFCFMHVNHGARENLGYTMDELQTMTPLDLKLDHTRDSIEMLLNPLVMGDQESIKFETHHWRKDGSSYPVEVRLQKSFFGDQDLYPVYVAVVLDITERQQVEQELQESREQALAANQAKSKFLANMSHGIRTPMTAILGFTDIMIDNLTNPENLDAAQTIKENGNYLLELINDILDLSKVEAGKLTSEIMACSPQVIVSGIASLMRVRASAKGLPLDAKFEGPIPETIQSDPTRLRQILINIVGNAIKFTETGSVQIITRLLEDRGNTPQLQFDVIDTGIGLPDKSIENLFQPFTQADNSTTRRFGGTGLGLTISKRLAEKLGGDITVNSSQGKGSTFSITVDVGDLSGVKMLKDVTEIASCQLSDEHAETNLVAQLDCRILLAEDGPVNLRLISFILRKAGAEVALAENGQIAFDLANQANSKGTPFDVILMDMQMPVLDGYAATQKLREAGYEAPIIALTAHAMTSDRQDCLDAGCNDFATKPINRKKLIQLIADYVSREKTQPLKQSSE